MLFSQRKGFTPSAKDLQTEWIDDELRNRIWSLLKLFVFDHYKAPSTHSGLKRSNLYPLVVALWHSFFKAPIDTIPQYFFEVEKQLREIFFKCEWYEIYDFVEFILSQNPLRASDRLSGGLNKVLEEENAGYRVVGGLVTQITSASEVEAIEQALADASPFEGVRAHLSTALRMMSDRENPDYRNSIKESISSVESICQVITGDSNATLGSALSKLEKRMTLHGAIKAGFSSLYGYTSGADGIRHAMLEEPTLTSIDARFMLVACSGFVSYLIGKVAELGVPIGQAA